MAMKQPIIGVLADRPWLIIWKDDDGKTAGFSTVNAPSPEMARAIVTECLKLSTYQKVLEAVWQNEYTIMPIICPSMSYKM